MYAFAVSLALCALGCGGDETSDGNGNSQGCSVEQQSGCGQGLVCEAVQGGAPGCFEPISVEGRVFDAADDASIEDARVVARDANGAAVSSVSISAADGTYSLVVPAPRDANGDPVATNYTLRADADGYQTFPAPPRVALPVDLSSAQGSPAVVQSAATDIALLALPDTTGLGTISGSVLEGPGSNTNLAGTLIVAGGQTALADSDGAYVVFNVPAGTGIMVSGYAAGLQIEPESADVSAGSETTDVDLQVSGTATATVSGSVSFVNAGGAKVTSVILVVDETFDPNAARGEAPPGLRADNVTGSFEIPDVPDGRYAVLAAFENDDLVRDPDTCIAGTDIVFVTVAGADQPLSEAFKITGALAVVSPGANGMDSVSGTPTFIWEDDSSDDHYELQVYDAFGTLVWEDLAVPSPSGGDDVTAMYGGPALDAGMIYQFKAKSIRKNSCPISSTEDLKGVFIYE